MKDNKSDFSTKSEKLEIVIPDMQVEAVLEIIHKIGKTGYSGDGIV